MDIVTFFPPWSWVIFGCAPDPHKVAQLPFQPELPPFSGPTLPRSLCYASQSTTYPGSWGSEMEQSVQYLLPFFHP